MQTNRESELALQFIQHTGMNLFLTGKAGTGKTTFLRRLRELLPKRMVVVAPTGVAAINAGGVTIHSFFQLPFTPYLPISGGGLPQEQRGFQNKFSKEKINIIRSLDLLVIDEVSMVRADVLDAISDVLRRYKNRNKPFGGVQLLLIGDMQQLAPVAKEEEWNLLKSYYTSPLFFDSRALAESRYLCIELTHVYRQSDGTFIRLLNNIRENRLDEATLHQLNARYIPGFRPDDKEGYITLTTHNNQAGQLNQQRLRELPGMSYYFKAEIKDDFPAYSFPTDERLELRLGAQVMFVRNDSSPDKRYFNGKIGKIVFINNEKITVVDEQGTEIAVERETWSNVKYTLDAETQAITETICGSFSQHPLKTAWAITIHKSQGLTFERAIIDASAAFSHGQVYVALSRCKTLEGLVLSSPITRSALVNDTRIDEFTTSMEEMHPSDAQLLQARQVYFEELVTELFLFGTLHQRLSYAAQVLYQHLQKLYPELCNQFAELRDTFRTKMVEVGERFRSQLSRLIAANPDNYATDPLLQERVRKGADYFLEELALCWPPLQKAARLELNNKEAGKSIAKALDSFTEELRVKQLTLKACREGFTTPRYLSAKAKASIEQSATPTRKRTERSATPKPTEPTVNTAFVENDDLYHRIWHWRNQIATAKELPAYVVLQQKALIGIANTRPTTKKALLAIPGVGQRTIDLYGNELLAMVSTSK